MLTAHTLVDNVDMSLNFHSKWTGKELFTELTGEDFAPARHQCVAAVCGWVVCPHIKCLLWKYECHFSGETLMAKPFMTLVLGRAGGGQPPLPAQTFYDICKHNKNKITLHHCRAAVAEVTLPRVLRVEFPNFDIDLHSIQSGYNALPLLKVIAFTFW